MASCSAKAAFRAAIWIKPFATLIRVSCSFAVSLELLKVDSEEEIFPRTTRFRFTSTVRALENAREKNFEQPIFGFYYCSIHSWKASEERHPLGENYFKDCYQQFFNNIG